MSRDWKVAKIIKILASDHRNNNVERESEGEARK